VRARAECPNRDFTPPSPVAPDSADEEAQSQAQEEAQSQAHEEEAKRAAESAAEWEAEWGAPPEQEEKKGVCAGQSVVRKDNRGTPFWIRKITKGKEGEEKKGKHEKDDEEKDTYYYVEVCLKGANGPHHIEELLAQELCRKYILQVYFHFWRSVSVLESGVCVCVCVCVCVLCCAVLCCAVLRSAVLRCAVGIHPLRVCACVRVRVCVQMMFGCSTSTRVL